MSSVPAAVANTPLTLETDWEALLKQCPLMDPNAPNKPDGVTEDSSPNLFVSIKDFKPTLGRIYLHKPMPMPTNQSVLDSEIWYIYNEPEKLACKLKVIVPPYTSSGFRFLYKYDESRTEDDRIKDNDPIRAFTLPARMWAGSAPTPLEADAELKITLASRIIQFQFFRWRKAMGRHMNDLVSLSNLRGMEKTVRYKLDDKGEREEGRGPTLTMRMYSTGVNGKKAVAPDFTLPYTDLECTTKVFMMRNRKRVQLNQKEIHNLMPQWVSREMKNGVRQVQEGDPTKFLFDCEMMCHFAKARWAAKSGSISRYVTQVMVGNVREAGEADFEGFSNFDEGDDEEGGDRTGNSGAMSWASMGQALNETTSTSSTASVSVKPGVIAASPVEAAVKTSEADAEQEGEEEEEADEGEEEEEEEAAAAPAPAPVTTKPGIVAAPAPAAAEAPKSRRAPKKA